MTPQEYAQTPATLKVRECPAQPFRAGGTRIVTTFPDAKAAPKNQLKVPHLRGWNVELDLRNIKTTLGTARLRCKTPEMVVKELRV